MAHSLSAQKRVRQNATRRLRNRMRRSTLKTAITAFLGLVHQQEVSKARDQLRRIYKLLDQLAAKGTIHANTAGRRKSRLAKQFADLEKHAETAA